MTPGVTADLPGPVPPSPAPPRPAPDTWCAGNDLQIAALMNLDRGRRPCSAEAADTCAPQEPRREGAGGGGWGGVADILSSFHVPAGWNFTEMKPVCWRVGVVMVTISRLTRGLVVVDIYSLQLQVTVSLVTPGGINAVLVAYHLPELGHTHAQDMNFSVCAPAPAP